MRRTRLAATPRLLRGRGRKEGGQTIIIVALALLVLTAFAGFVIDVGRIYVAQRQLQQAVDAASLAASVDLTTSSATALSTAQTYSAAGSKNTYSDMTANALVANPAAGQSGVTFLCLGHTTTNTSGAPCITDNNYCPNTPAPGPYLGASTIPGCNALRVVETATVNTSFLGVLGFGSFNAISASSTASLEGGVPHPLDVVILVDTSPSMREYCNTTVTGISNSPGGSFPTPNKLDCVKQGIRTLLQTLLPCAPDLPGCGSPNGVGNVPYPDDEVSLMVLPGLTNGLADHPKELDCVDQGTHTTPTQLPVSYPAGGPLTVPNYQVVPFQSDYRSNDGTTSLTASSRLVEAVWWTGPGCPGSGANAPSNDIYGEESTSNNLGSSFADAITSAQAALAANAVANPGRNAQPVIIFLSDGEGNTSGSHAGSTPCLDAYNAAHAAKTTTLPGNANPTWIYSIAYNSSLNCTDARGSSYYNVAGLQLMKDIATNTTSYFFNQPAAGDLTAAFQSAGAALTGSRLVPADSQ